MFRKMRRSAQQLDVAECVRILEEEPRGVLSVIGDGGYPYGVPIDHWYCSEDGNIYFHGAKTGHKIDAIKECGKASYCVFDKGYRHDGEWSLNIKSVIAFGRISVVDDEETMLKICRSLCAKFTDDMEYTENEIKNFGSKVLCLRFEPEHITGKLVNES